MRSDSTAHPGTPSPRHLSPRVKSTLLTCAHVASVLATLLLLSSSASAQATLAGVVRDPSGAVLPGVTVEASSPALIEKTRVAVTDNNGQYQIIDLRPGTYTVVYSLAGFSTSRREGVAVTGGSYHGGLRQRWVTHLDVDTADVDRALEIVAGFRG